MKSLEFTVHFSPEKITREDLEKKLVGMGLTLQPVALKCATQFVFVSYEGEETYDTLLAQLSTLSDVAYAYPRISVTVPDTPEPQQPKTKQHTTNRYEAPPS